MRKWHKTVVSAMLIVILTCSSLFSFVYAQPDEKQPLRTDNKAVTLVTVTVKGKPLQQQGIMGEEGVLLPLQLIEKGLHISVNYDAEKKSYILQRDQVAVVLTPTDGEANAVVNGSTQITPYEWKQIGEQPYVSAKVITDHLGYTSQYNEANQTLALTKHKLNPITISTVTIEKDIPEATIKVEYPQISGLDNTKAEKSINKQLKTRADEFVKNSIKEAKNSQPSPNGSKYEYLGNYTVTFNREGVLSILEQTYAYTGGAHGNSIREGLTFCLSNGKLLTLDQILSANPNYRKIVDPQILQQLKKTEGYFNNFTTIGPNPDFYLKDEGVVVFFQLYEYLPYVFGFPEFYFPISELLPEGANPFEACK
jgi:hypothetical protein